MPLAFCTSESKPRREARAGVAVGRQRDGDDAGTDLGTRLRREPERGHPARPIPLHEDVRLSQQAAEPLAVLLGAQVERGRELAATGVRVQQRKSGQMRRRDAHNVGAVRRKRAAAHRAGDDARQIEHADARQRPLAGGWQRAGRRFADLADLEQRKLRYRAPLRMRGPFCRRARHAGNQLGVGGRRLEFLALPFGQRGLHGLALIGAAEQLQHALAMVQKVGVETHRAPIAGAIDAGDLVPGGARRIAGKSHVAFAAELDCRRTHVDRDGLRAPRPLPPDLCRCQRRGGDRRLRCGAYAERGGQHRLRAGQRDTRQRRRLAGG
jgi:hypothetical protein